MPTGTDIDFRPFCHHHEGAWALCPRDNKVTETTQINQDQNTFAAAGVAFTDAAARKVHELILEEGNPALNLRVYISGGGCSGFQYGFSFDESRGDDDVAVENDGVTLLIDPLSFQYLMGAEVDYSETLQGAQFVIRNPNATTTCGCGSSFSV
jgi:iron-sulfur cluster insertion protein